MREALVPTLSAYLVQTMAQTITSPVRVSLIFALEPVFAALGGWWIAEIITLQVIVGGALILMGMLTAELGHLLRRQKAPTLLNNHL